ncbi:hypothetical protein N7539_000628 [Penicillium diatomitis]|uniref:Uncharacterized protein n=1 Tax=Penicillium diatomitis TaxID=2819901 RepID=A0A9W9XM14_9EURO|nr:uncharacterized protein N7539_000628 [Penicillium diatomitis]KAJ5495512.1 hypothetical protein N7539_000628 [Penicillium diatomitis]
MKLAKLLTEYLLIIWDRMDPSDKVSLGCSFLGTMSIFTRSGVLKLLENLGKDKAASTIANDHSSKSVPHPAWGSLCYAICPSEGVFPSMTVWQNLAVHYHLDFAICIFQPLGLHLRAQSMIVGHVSFLNPLVKRHPGAARQ